MNISASKTEVLCIKQGQPVVANGEPLDFVVEFIYLGSLVSKDNAAQNVIKVRLRKACSSFALQLIGSESNTIFW